MTWKRRQSLIKTSERLNEIETRVAKTTPGPWTARSHMHLEKGCRCFSCRDSTGMELESPWPSCDEVKRLFDNDDCYQRVLTWEDADFIVHAREDIEWLIARVKELEALRKYRL